MYPMIISIFLIELFCFTTLTQAVSEKTIIPILFMNNTEAYTENIMQNWEPNQLLESQITIPKKKLGLKKTLKVQQKIACKYCIKIINKKSIRHHETYRCKKRPNKVYYPCQHCDHKHNHPRDREKHQKNCIQKELTSKIYQYGRALLGSTSKPLSKIIKTYPVTKSSRNLYPPSNCKYCDKYVKAKNNLKRHETYYCKDRPIKIAYLCQYCDRQFSHPSNRKTHEKNCKIPPIS